MLSTCVVEAASVLFKTNTCGALRSEAAAANILVPQLLSTRTHFTISYKTLKKLLQCENVLKLLPCLVIIPHNLDFDNMIYTNTMT